MARMSWVGPVVVALGACTASDGARRAGLETGGIDSAVVSASTPTEARVSSVMLGRRIGAGNRIIEPTFEFATTDTVFLSVATSGAGEHELTAAWRSQSGEILQQSAESGGGAGENAVFRFEPSKGRRPGTYKVVLFHGEDSADTKVFVVRK